MKDKTPLQELIEYLNKDFEWFVKNSPEYGVVPQIITKAKELLEKERQVVADSFYMGCKYQNGENKSWESYNPMTGNQQPNKELNFEDYFTNKYQTND